MKKYLIAGAGLIAVVCQAAVEQRVDVAVTLAASTFITGEPVLIQAKVINLTRAPLAFKPDSQDQFFIEVTRAGQLGELAPVADKPFIKPFTLAPGATFEHALEADKWFALYDSGKYIIRAVVLLGDTRYESAQRSFDVVPGLPLKEALQMFTNKKNLQRNFKLVYWTRDRVNRLFLRIEDEPGGLVWDTIELGMLARDGNPRLDIALNGEVTIIHRATRDSFLRTVVWSLPDSVEIAERNALVDPDISASQRVRSLYGDLEDQTQQKKSSWWKFW